MFTKPSMADIRHLFTQPRAVAFFAFGVLLGGSIALALAKSSMLGYALTLAGFLLTIAVCYAHTAPEAARTHVTTK